jgi:hypothetical protein
LILGSCSSLGVQMFPDIAIWRFQLFYYVWSCVDCIRSVSCIYLDLALSLIQMIVEILRIVLNRLSVLLIFKNFGQNNFCALWLVDWIIRTNTLNAHTSAVDCIKLIFNSNTCSWRSISPSSIRIDCILSNWWSCYI